RVTVRAPMMVPRGGLLSRHDAPPTLMTISLSGSAGPENGGMTALGGRAVQQVTPTEGGANREPVRAPAQKPPDMTVPLPNAKPVKAAPAASVKQAPDEARGRTPNKSKEGALGSE